MTDIQQLITQLNSLDFQAEDSAKHGLIAAGTVAVDPLIGVLNQPPSRARTLAVAILGEIKDRRALEQLLTIAQNPSDKNCTDAALALTEFHDSSVIPVLVQLAANQPRGQMRPALLAALDKLGQHDWVMDFACHIAFDKQGHTSDRLAMMQVLEPVNAPATADLILRYLRTNRVEPDYLTFGILNKIRSQPVYDFLLELLSHANPTVRGNAILILADASYKDAVKPIKALERDAAVFKNADQDGPRQTVADLAKYAVKKLQPGWRLW